MISKICKKISLFLCRKNIIEYEDFEIYKYGFETICSTLLGFIITIFIGIIFRMFLLSIVYYVMFVAIRQFTGGYHARSYFRCNLTFSIVTAIVFSFTRLAIFTNTYTMVNHIMFLVLSFMTVWYYAPVENENKPLDQEQKKRNRRIGLSMTGIVSILSCVVYPFSLKTSIMTALTQTAIAILIIISQGEKADEGNAEKQ